MNATISRRQRVLALGGIVSGIVVMAFVLRGLIVLPQVIDLGVLQIRLYSLCILGAVGAAAYVFDRLARRDLPGLDVWTGLLYVMIPAIIGARLYHVVTEWPIYAANPVSALALWNGGLGIIGGAVGGALGGYIFARRYKLDYWKLLGLLAIVLPLGQAIGRLGNLFNYELYGPPTDLPWGLFVPAKFRTNELLLFEHFHPLFLYEMLGTITLFLLGLWLRSRRVADRAILLAYLIGYSSLRFLLEFMRISGNPSWNGLTYTQWLLLFALPVLLLLCGIWYKQGKLKN